MAVLEFNLQGKTALVTGGAGCIGRAVCEGFAAAGAQVAVVDIEQEACDAVAEAMGPGHRGWGADLREIAGIDPLVGEISGAMGPVDILANIAAVIIRTNDLFTVTPDEWNAQYDVNIKAMFFLCQSVARRMVEAGREGTIINYSSQGWNSGGFGGSVVYNSTKGAVTTMTRGLARSWAAHGIRVNAVAPGLVDTPMMRSDALPSSVLDALVKDIPMKRLGHPDDHVGATVFLATDMARYMTGATMNVSGGFLMH